MKKKVNVLFIGGSYNAEIVKIPKINLDVGFIELYPNRASDELVYYILDSDIESEQQERYYVTKMLIDDGEPDIYVAIEHHKLMLIAKNELPAVVLNKKLGI